MLTVREIFGEEIDEQNQSYIEKMKKESEDDRISWVLGAGLSVPAHLPQWERLITNMWILLVEINRYKERNNVYQKKYDDLMDILYGSEDCREQYFGKFSEAMKEDANAFLKNMNVLESAEYLLNLIKDQVLDEYENEKTAMGVLKVLVREALKLGIERDVFSEPGRAELKKKLEKETIGVIASVLKKKKKGCMITYNFDDLLEFCLETIGEIDQKEVWIGCDNHQIPGMEPIRIYHPHGKIKMFSEWTPEESEKIILTETDYYEMERKAYNWANSIQANALAERTCVFIGFSGADYNFRRIIKNCDEIEEPRHYIFMGIDTLVSRFMGDIIEKRYRDPGNKLDKDEILREMLKAPEYIFRQVHMTKFCYAQMKYWEKHGITPIWCSFEEMPGFIKRIGGVNS